MALGGPEQPATDCARVKGMVVWVRRLAAELAGALFGVVPVGTVMCGRGEVGMKDVMVSSPPRRTTFFELELSSKLPAGVWVCAWEALPQQPSLA